MSNEEVIYYGGSLQANQKKLQHVYDVMSLTLGVGSGILMLETLQGFLFYLVGISITNVAFYIMCCEKSASRFFRSPFQEIFINGIVSNAAGYVMMWCLVYALVK